MRTRSAGPIVTARQRGGVLPRRRLAIAVATAALLAAGCGEEKPPTKPPVDPPAPGALFVEPLAYCLPADAVSDTLFIHNLGDTTLVWTPQRSPVASTGLDAEVRVEPGTAVAVVWQWITAVAYPQRDTLVAVTNDPERPEVTIPFVRHEPGHADTEPPSAPRLGLPRDGATVYVETEFELLWTHVSDCSGIAAYQIQIAADPGFQTLLLVDQVAAASATVTPEAGDEGPAYWRVRARDGRGLFGAWSDSRSWTVLPQGEAP